jgi:hypothetical protein
MTDGVCTDPAELDAWIEARKAEGKRVEWGVIRSPAGEEKRVAMVLPPLPKQGAKSDG